MFLIALMRVKTVNLVEIATGFSGEAKVASHYKRLQRFFKEFEVDYESIALMVVKVMKIPEPWVISIDRTDWRFGKTVFNVLTLKSTQKVTLPILARVAFLLECAIAKFCYLVFCRFRSLSTNV
jgi:hypothetical protein